MRVVFEKFEQPLPIEAGKISVLQIADPSLFSRCAYSLANEYVAGVLEPAAFFDDSNSELKTSDLLFVVGDILSFDLNDKRVLALAIKRMLTQLEDDDSYNVLEGINLQLEDVFESHAMQLSGNYGLLNDWDASRYLKMAGFGVDVTYDISPFDKVRHLLRIASDLFPEKVLAFINLCTLLPQSQFDELCELVAAEQLMVMLYETSDTINFQNLDNRLFVDENYIEY